MDINKNAKYCNSCKSWKSIEMYSKDRRKKDGLMVYCKECMNQRNKEYRENNKEKIRAGKIRYRETHKEKIKEYHSRKETKERINAYNNKYIKERYRKDEVYRYKLVIRANILASVKQHKFIQKGNLEKIIGCDIDCFINYLRNTYQDNYGKTLTDNDNVQIDHIIPLATAETIDEVNKLCYYTNLQLLKTHDNQVKGQKINWKINSESR